MFENKVYWFEIEGFKKKGLVLEEDNFFIKIKRDNGSEEILNKSNITKVNQERKKEE